MKWTKLTFVCKTYASGIMQPYRLFNVYNRNTRITFNLNK